MSHFKASFIVARSNVTIRQSVSTNHNINPLWTRSSPISNHFFSLDYSRSALLIVVRLHSQFAARFKLCVNKALCGQYARVCGYLCRVSVCRVSVCRVCVSACVCMCVCVRGLRIVFTDKILRFTNTSIINRLLTTWEDKGKPNSRNRTDRSA